MNLSSFQAKRCQTVAAWALHEQRLLLIKHKKLGIWLAPGGHVEANELPHQAAEREFFEETGVRGIVVSAAPELKSTSSEFLPMPFLSNLHVINKPRGQDFCEQHYSFAYFIKAAISSPLKRQVAEIDAIGWFTQAELSMIDITPDIQTEAAYVFAHFPV